MNDFRQDLSAKVMTTQEQSMDSSTTDGEVLKLLCQMKEVQDVMTALNESSVKLTEKVIAFESVVRSQKDKLVGLESSLTSQGQKLSAMDNILSRMNAAKPKAPPPCGPAPDLPATEAPLPPPPSLPPRQWAAASTTPASATPSGVILPTVPGNLVMPGLQLPTGSLPCAPFQTGGTLGPSSTTVTMAPQQDMATVYWDGKAYLMPAALAQQMHGNQPMQPRP